ncbi:uncharacterized protein PFL1_04024 [Pseudozyma flocculosa PF-1]|uniref:Vacuolar membrane protein n=1 Tax=Pseudozyma flocculosa PF-1 TaxID=1277687 RepID=A0A061HC50_9BASI|nr:uncharacterized protein PFL1_04024 [Pseudozyma flocculosa PF-1]EPQ28196.1 hypothetical protein PFL1_04024 [Pseudozyma flocculosa PF-1]
MSYPPPLIASTLLATPSPSAFASASATPSPPYPNLPVPVPDVDSNSCRLLGPFALFVQLAMGLLVLASLVYKRHKERPKRKWKIWLLDITKQMLGQMFVHVLNVAFSEGGSGGGGGGGTETHAGSLGGVAGAAALDAPPRKAEGRNPCSLYFLNVLIDTTLGVFIIYTLLSLLTHILTDVLRLRGFVSGQYSDRPIAPASASGSQQQHQQQQIPTTRRGRTARPRLSYWAKQLAVYLFVLLLMKLSVLVILAVFPFLIDMGSWLLKLFGSHKDAQVLFSMALFPLAMNVLQFWLIDSLLRHNPTTSKYAQVPSEPTSMHEPHGPSSSSPPPPSQAGARQRHLRRGGGRGGVDDDPERQDTGPIHLIGDDDESDESDGEDGDSRDAASSFDYRGHDAGKPSASASASASMSASRDGRQPSSHDVDADEDEAEDGYAYPPAEMRPSASRSRSVSPRLVDVHQPAQRGPA